MISLAALLVLSHLQNKDLIANGSFDLGPEPWQGNGQKQVLSEGGHHFVRMVIKKKPGLPYDYMITQPIDAKLPNGSDVTILFEGRSPTGNKVNAMIEDSGQPYAKYLQSDFVFGSAWKPYSLTGKLNKDLESGASQLTIHCGFGIGTIDLRNIKLVCPSAIVVRETFPQTLLVVSQAGNDPRWIGEGSVKPTTETVKTGRNDFPSATKVTIDSVGNNPWDCQASTVPISGGIQKRSIAYMKVWLRSQNKVSVTMVFEQKSPPNSKNIYESVTPDNKWREFMVAVPATQSLGKSDSQIKLFFVGKGVVEVGPASLENLGPKVDLTKLPQYLGRTPYVVNPEWRRKNDAQIAAVRKGSLTVVVTKSQGKPLRDVTVKVTQLTHRFRFGTAIPVGLMMQEDADGDHIRQVIKRMFNTVTFGNDLKWNGGGPELFPDWIYPAYAWIHKNGIELRGHNLVWGSYQYLPAVDKNWSKEKTWEVVQAHVKDYAERMKGKVYVWDVVNEAVTETELWDKIGWDKFVEVYRIVRQADPKVELAYNDYDMNSKGHRDAAIARANSIKSAGAPINVFGDQSHLSRPIVMPDELRSIWDEINAKTGLPIEVTEFDFSSFDDKLQADYVEDFYRTAFAHPKVQGIVMWGFWEKDHWKAAQGGHMIRADWTWRPAMTALDTLINKTWRTNVELKTNANGEVQIPAFFGKYQVTAGGKTQIVNHFAAGTVVRIR